MTFFSSNEGNKQHPDIVALRNEISKEMKSIFEKFKKNREFTVFPSQPDNVINMTLMVECHDSFGLLNLMKTLKDNKIFIGTNRKYEENDSYNLFFRMKDSKDVDSFKLAAEVLSVNGLLDLDLYNTIKNSPDLHKETQPKPQK